jgi:hypothetical protein
MDAGWQLFVLPAILSDTESNFRFIDTPAIQIRVDGTQTVIEINRKEPLKNKN